MVEALTPVVAALRRRPLLPLLLLALLALPSATFAHRLDEYLQATLVAIEPGSIRLEINLTPGVAIAEQVLALIDRDRDGAISPNEAAAYAELVRRDLRVRLDQRDAELKLTASKFPEPAELRSGVGIIQLEFSVTPSRLAAGTHRLTLENRHLPAVSVYLINAAKPIAETLQITAQRRNENQSAGEIEFTFHPPPAAAPKRVGIMFALGELLVVAFLAAGWRTVKRAARSGRAQRESVSTGI
jgi:hypothetical protein